MTEKEIRLINIINEQNNPELALEIAIEIISDYLERQKSFVEQVPVDFRELA